MKISFQKQVQFTKYIKTTLGLKEFNFLKIKGFDAPSYHIDVSDERGKRHEFLMVGDDNGWTMQGKDLPLWATGAEHAIIDAIKEEEN
ncbi:MAG: hypothetical protein JST47_08850 [Bacteroidetes bacterium]|nr:hypothetical protein [Bacteroidota bacterium]MBS1975228.1 hypothetical protein [Bacteroidota bacterium]